VHEVGDLLDHARVAALLDPERQLVDDDRGLAPAQLLDVGASAHHDPTPAGAVGLSDPLPPEDDRAGREVRAFDVPRQPVDVDGRVVDHRDERVDHLAEVVGWDVRRHADRDPGRPVDEQVREPRRQHVGLLPRLVVVRPEVDGVRVDVTEHLRGDARKPDLGVVAHEPVAQERVVAALDAQRVDGLDPRVGY
jgi:hypothetical protein